MLFKKRRSKASLFPTLDQCKIDNNKLNITDTSDMEDDSQTWFWNKSVNETDLDSEEEDNDEDNNKNLEREYPKIESKASFEVLKQKLK